MEGTTTIFNLGSTPTEAHMVRASTIITLVLNNDKPHVKCLPPSSVAVQSAVATNSGSVYLHVGQMYPYLGIGIDSDFLQVVLSSCSDAAKEHLL